MSRNDDFFLFSGNEQPEVVPGNKDMESNEQKEDAPAMNPNSVDNQSKEGGKPPLFKESHTPTVIESSESDPDNHSKIEEAEEKQKPSKANPKEIVFLDEEGDVPSKESESDSDEIAIPEHGEQSTISDSEKEVVTPEEDFEFSGDAFDLEVAESYFNRQNGTTVCRKCGQPGHKAAECPNVSSLEPCILCAETDHLAKNCPTNICRHCNQQGHNTKNCPLHKVPPPCIYCSSRLHKSDNCPMMPKPCDKSVFQNVHCLVCGQRGHIICKQQPPLQGSTYGRCAICGSRNHSYKMCPDRYNHRTVHSGEGNGAGACFICGQFGHIAANCTYRRQNSKRDKPNDGKEKSSKGRPKHKRM